MTSYEENRFEHWFGLLERSWDQREMNAVLSSEISPLNPVFVFKFCNVKEIHNAVRKGDKFKN